MFERVLLQGSQGVVGDAAQRSPPFGDVYSDRMRYGLSFRIYETADTPGFWAGCWVRIASSECDVYG